MSVAVIGAGPAGVSAVAWLDKFGCPFTWFDAEGTIGGMLHDVHNAIRDYPGLAADRGVEAARLLASWSHHHPGTHAVVSIRREGSRFGVDEQEFDAVVIATGTRKRRLGVPGEDEGMGDWVTQSAARDAHRYAGREVAVVGGGDSAVEGTIRLVEAGASRVVLLARSPLRARASFRRRLEECGDVVDLRVGAEVVKISRSETGCVAQLRDGSLVEVAALFVRIGVVPALPALELPLLVDEEGFVVTDEGGHTSVPGIFAAGDVTSTPLRSIASAVGNGATAARSAAAWLERPSMESRSS